MISVTLLSVIYACKECILDLYFRGYLEEFECSTNKAKARQDRRVHYSIASAHASLERFCILRSDQNANILRPDHFVFSHIEQQRRIESDFVQRGAFGAHRLSYMKSIVGLRENAFHQDHRIQLISAHQPSVFNSPTSPLSLASSQCPLPTRYNRLLHAAASIPTPEGCCTPPGRVPRAVLGPPNWRETSERSRSEGVSPSQHRQKRAQRTQGDSAAAGSSCSLSDGAVRWDTNHHHGEGG